MKLSEAYLSAHTKTKIFMMTTTVTTVFYKKDKILYISYKNTFLMMRASSHARWKTVHERKVVYTMKSCSLQISDSERRGCEYVNWNSAPGMLYLKLKCLTINQWRQLLRFNIFLTENYFVRMFQIIWYTAECFIIFNAFLRIFHESPVL